MSSPYGKTGIAPIIMVIMLSIGLLNHVIIMPLLLGEAGRDAWISILLCSALLPLWLLIVHRVVKAVRQQPMLAWIQSVSGKASRMTVAFIFGVLLVMDIVITSTDTLTWATTTYLPKTPMVVTTSVFLILCGFAAYVGFRTIAIVSGILLPFVILLGFFVAGANTGRKNYNELFPVLEHGWSPVLQGMLIVGGGFAELILFILLQQYANSPFKRKQILLTGVIISVLCMGPTVAALAEFGPAEAGLQRYPAFSQWRLVQIGKYIEHLDFFAIYQWLSGAFVRTAAALCLLADMFGFRSGKHRGAFIALVNFLVLFVNVYPTGDSLQYFLVSLYTPLMLPIALLLSLYLFLLAVVSRKGGKSNAQNGA